jgi:hypothetical protein
MRIVTTALDALTTLVTRPTLFDPLASGPAREAVHAS